jgi:ABC-type antimicrobial peptide transport system permease subunit
MRRPHLRAIPRRVAEESVFAARWLRSVTIIFFLLPLYLVISSQRAATRIFHRQNTLGEEKWWTVRGARRLSRIGVPKGAMDRFELVELAVHNMLLRRSRAFVTIGGMALGIGTIVFLVSLGYGVQQLVVSRVARLDELQQADVVAHAGSQLRLSDESVVKLEQIDGVGQVLPLISVVGKVMYQNSAADVAVYGVTTEYLRQSAIQPSHGQLFDSNERTIAAASLPSSAVQGIALEASGSATVGQLATEQVEVSIEPTQWLKIRSAPRTTAPVIGYSRREAGQLLASEVWGEAYPEAGASQVTDVAGRPLNKWLAADFPLWEKTDCVPGSDDFCEVGGYQPQVDENGSQIEESGYTAQIGMEIAAAYGLGSGSGAVLGESIDLLSLLASSSATASDSAEQALMALASGSGLLTQEQQTKTVALASVAKRQAVVNQAMLKVLGITENEAVGKQFEVQFISTSTSARDPSERLESEKAQYSIVGVVPSDGTPLFYVPLIDLRSLGVDKYAQLKVVAKDKELLSTVRRQIEALGFVSTSVVDTLERIDQLFNTARWVLASLGIIALSVASLGMFNTMTVSLLERTREVGLLKAMGMRSQEVRDLFLTEAMVMGFLGGLAGVSVGVVLGKLVSLVISIMAISKGQGFLDVSYVPPAFALLVFVGALIVSVCTGIYPARRTTKISALNALRYE